MFLKEIQLILYAKILIFIWATQNIWDKSSHIGITQEEITKKQYKEYRKEALEHFKNRLLKLNFLLMSMELKWDLKELIGEWEKSISRHCAGIFRI